MKKPKSLYERYYEGRAVEFWLLVASGINVCIAIAVAVIVFTQ